MDNLEKHEIPSIGGDVADLFGTLESLQTGESFTGSMNPQGNRFEGKNIEQSLVEFGSTWGQQGMQILKSRLDDLKNSQPDLFEGDNSPYQKAADFIGEKLESKE
ncbi:hypothetical protein A2380_02785 [candidate division WWE3 bacterium RIFOXYB1_FULL_43_24]|nr:MAG: hypothetical protein A2212_01945 [candidate division WWE3 bacterium RIFOXYA1_FULL_42_9]OGC69030.1 MAG: hypothetical protein A2380_02785 [candidate division WWE3 bacterium RIFOXYB1_FULL_43_24]OGC73031.1 MAG: hypothetical protein A2414_01210 [candidate division WWE3 bacterium RIFOXYC1_FULL_42_13]